MKKMSSRFSERDNRLLSKSLIEWYVIFCFVATCLLAGFGIYYAYKYLDNPAEIGKFIKEIERGYNQE